MRSTGDLNTVTTRSWQPLALRVQATSPSTLFTMYSSPGAPWCASRMSFGFFSASIFCAHFQPEEFFHLLGLATHLFSSAGPSSPQ